RGDLIENVLWEQPQEPPLFPFVVIDRCGCQPKEEQAWAAIPQMVDQGAVTRRWSMVSLVEDDDQFVRCGAQKCVELGMAPLIGVRCRLQRADDHIVGGHDRVKLAVFGSSRNHTNR